MHSLQLHNTYLLMRHAQSKANHMHIIVSNSEVGVNDYGLTQEGKNEVMKAIAHCNELKSVEYIYTSDFLRAYETSMIIAGHMNIIHVKFDIRLRERYFGQFEGTDSGNYQRIWDMDCCNVHDPVCYDVEPIHTVAKRMISFLFDCETNHINDTILIVSHGDPLQILYTVSIGLPINKFKTASHFNNAELRLLPSRFTIDEELIT
ncbi:MAG TPA: histidine phosphatase family protein [Spirochaetota bacterium]|nr:histidine phosphatase family protein [Spirochaetota bacterium]